MATGGPARQTLAKATRPKRPPDPIVSPLPHPADARLGNLERQQLLQRGAPAVGERAQLTVPRVAPPRTATAETRAPAAKKPGEKAKRQDAKDARGKGEKGTDQKGKDQKGKDQKAKREKEKAKEEKGKGKEEPGKEEGKAGPEGGGGGREEWRGAGQETARGGGDDEVDEVALEPPPAPRFEGTQAVRLTMPLLTATQEEQVRTQTGLALTEHYDRVQTLLDRLSSRAEQEQRAIAFHVEAMAAGARRDLDATAARIPEQVGAAIGTIRASYGGARASIGTAADAALKKIDAHASAADKQVDDSALMSKTAVENAILSCSPKLQAVYQETMTPLKTALSDSAKKMKDIAKEQAKAMETEGTKVAAAVLEQGSTAIEQGQSEAKSKAVPDLAKEAGKDLVQAGDDGAADVMDQETSLSLSFLAMVNPAAVKIEHVGGTDKDNAAGKEAQVKVRLRTDYERARAFVEETRDRALKTLEAGERSSVEQLHKLQHRLEVMARQRRDQLSNAMLQGQAPAVDAWAQQMARANQMVPPGGQLVDARRLEPRLAEVTESMNELLGRQRADFDVQAGSGLDDAHRGMEEDRAAIGEALDAALAGTRDIDQQVGAMGGMADNFASGFRGVAHPASSQASEYRTKAEEQLGQPVKAVRDGMNAMLKEVSKSLTDSETKFTTALKDQVTKLGTNLGPALDQVGLQVIEADPTGLEKRENALYAAMDRIGTDETGVFNALHGLTPKMGKALEQYWKEVATHTHDLRWWLDDELSGDEYQAAIHYLDGNPSEGAKYEISASFHWYGDDTKQIEGALRALPPEELAKLKNDPGFKAVNAKIQSSLHGTDLDVTNALLAGRVARADALRLKEQIDSARMSEDDDKLHDALSNVDPKRLPEVRRELADVLAGKSMTDQPPAVTDQDAVAALTKYVTAPVDVYDPGTDSYRQATLSQPSAKLAEALVAHGEGSPEARGARLAFEASRDSKPRPEKLAKALDDPDLIRARKNPLLEKANDDPRGAARARAELERLEGERTKALQEFAKLRGADEQAKTNPARAQEYAANAVADMFGDDDLGRELGSSMVKDGKANPAVAIKFAVRGAGTDEDLIKRTLRGMTPAEIAALKVDYAARFGDGNANALYDDLGVFQNEDTAKAAGTEHATGGGFFTELSGDDRLEVEELLLGTPQNDRDRYRLAKLKSQHQLGEGSTAVSRGVGLGDSDPARAIKLNEAQMNKMVADAGGPDKAFDEKGNFKERPDLGLSANQFRLHVAGVSGGAEDYKHHVDSIADMITGAIAIIGAIVGTIVVTVLTLGTATPLVVGLWAAGIAAATGAASMAVNYSLKGSRYGWEQAAVDGALTLLDAATAGLMAGAGAKAARAAAELAAVKALARTPTQVAAAERLAQRHAQKELVRGFVRAAAGAGVSGMARTSLADGTWDDGFLKGLGHVVGSGLKSAAVGVATHGAVTGFHATSLGQGLQNSTGYLGRGLGAGLSGAIGGMAGRSAELGLGALSGEKIGPWYEAMGSILQAGGRGFVENVGEGIASVPKARRDQLQARKETAAAEADAKRVARYGTDASDEARDLEFRRRAAGAALHEDKRTELRQFLKDLDEGVAGDRAAAETHRQLVREFRREALSGIPPEQRAAFADVPIHILSDADFERFTGSTSGRAVTIIVDGQPQIIARRSAAPETMREEGIHVLQSRDPRWKDRVGRLDESNLARWREMDLETQLSLYRDKLEIEIDGQERLRRGLLEEAETTRDPARQAALRERAAATEQTEEALRARRAEVDGLGPAQRDAIRSGEADFPQYLRQEPRLFSKVAVSQEIPDELHPTKRGRPLDHGDRDLATEPRRPVALHNTTWEDDYPGMRVFQVGDAWREPHEGRMRWYRMVEVADEEGNVVDRRREILQERGTSSRWQQRGSESTTWGRIFEQASRLFTAARLKSWMGVRRIDPETAEAVPIGSIRGKTSGKAMSAQYGGGAGFDDVVFHFFNEGGELRAHIIIVEAKGYRRSMTLGDFSAITTNVESNLGNLSTAMLDADLPPERLRAVQEAIGRGDVSFVVHASETTVLGQHGAAGATILEDIRNNFAARRQLAAVTAILEEVDPLELTPAERAQLQRDLDRVGMLTYDLNEAFAAERIQSEEVRDLLNATLEGGDGADSMAAIAARYVDEPLDQTRPLIRRGTLDTEGADARFVERARRQLNEDRNLQRSAGFGIGLAQALGIVGRDPRPVPVADAEVKVVRSTGKKPLAVVNPSATPASPAAEDAVIDKLAGVVHGGVASAKGPKVAAETVLWDASSTDPGAIKRVLAGARAKIEANGDAPERLQVMVDGPIAATEGELRSLLRLPAKAEVKEVERPPHAQATWVISFPPSSGGGKKKGGPR